MTDSLPPFPESDSESSQPTPPPSQPRQRLDGDEWIAIWVTLITLGGILIWGLTNQTKNLFVNNRIGNLFPTPTVSPESTVVPVPQPTVETPKIFTSTPRQAAKPATPPPVVVAPPAAVSSETMSEHWSQPFADQLVEKEYLTDQIGENWRPDQTITREEWAAYIVEVFDEGRTVQSAKDFPDLPPEEWAKRNIERAVELGFMEGYAEGEFRPDQKITRAELLVALASGLELSTPSNAEEVIEIYRDKQEIPDWAIDQIAAATQANLVVDYPSKNRLKPEKSVTQGEAIAFLHQALVQSGKISEIESPYIVDYP